MKVFISSTFKDLAEYRDKAIEVVLRHKCEPLAMEYFGARAEEPKKVCEKEIRECDVFIGIYAHRYGFVPEGETKSITQLEYELAKDLKPCLCFIVEESYPWNPKFIEMEKYGALTRFLDKVKKERTVESFKSPDHFMGILSTSLAKHIKEKEGTPVHVEKACLIPAAPIPYMAHPYALPEHFTGRRAEMAMLSNWFFNEKEPVLVLEAIGGMGKSALSWAWLHQEIMDRAVKVDGVFWWSFYDEPFESFLIHLYCYVTGKEDTQTVDLGNLRAVLNQRRFLLILDGYERALRGYAGMEAMYIQENRFAGNTQAENEWDKRQREPVHPQAGRFLQALCTGNTKTVMTTRLLPVSLEGITGVKHIFLTGLSAEDTVNFFRSEGINGTRAEMEQVGRVYDFHPLMLKLLASAIKRSRAKDIKQAFSLDIINQKEPHKILERSVGLLSEEERKVATRTAVFRGAFSFDAVKALAQEVEERQLWKVMQELRNLGFLFYDESRDRFDFHPILRSYLYGQLTTSGGTALHDLAAQYFEAMPKSEKVVTLEDLSPVIELYHHLVKAGKYDEARELFRDRIVNVIYFQLSAYHLMIELLKELFPEGKIEGQLPLLKEEADQAWTLNSRANSYSLSGQPVKAVPFYLEFVKISEENHKEKNLTIGLENAASMAQIYIGQVSAASAHLRKSVALCVKIKERFWEAAGRQKLGRVLAFQGRVKSSVRLNPLLNGSACVEMEFNQAFKISNKRKDYQVLSSISAYRSLSALFQTWLADSIHGEKKHSGKLSLEALRQSRRALTFAEKWTKNNYPLPRHFVRAYWLLGEALIRYGIESTSRQKVIKPYDFNIPFYDEYFQQVVETVTVTASAKSILSAAGRCLHEALRRCRTVNLVGFEPDILLALARLDVAHNKPPDETLLKEAFEIANRSGYRLKLADLHLFCGQVLLQFKDQKSLRNLTAAQHLQKTKEYALDVSEFSHLYKPVKSPADEFYKDIPEYEMLKRGMTDEERIKNGYWIAYQIAEILEKPAHE